MCNGVYLHGSGIVNLHHDRALSSASKIAPKLPPVSELQTHMTASYSAFLLPPAKSRTAREGWWSTPLWLHVQSLGESFVRTNICIMDKEGLIGTSTQLR